MKSQSSGSIINIKDLNFFFKIIKKNWWIILVSLVLSYISYTVYIYKQPIISSASTQLLLQANEEYNPASVVSDDNGSFYAGTYRTYVDNSNESRVIMTYDLIYKALEKLDFDVSYYIVGRVKTDEVYTGLNFHVKPIHVNPEFYEKPFKFSFIDEKTYRISFQKGKEEIELKGKFNEELIATEFKLLINSSASVNAITIANLKTGNYIFEIHEKNSLALKFQALLNIENPDYTNILKISVSDVITERAVKFLDTLSKVYLDNTLKTKFELNEKTLFYIDKQMKEVVSVLDNIEDTMQAFKEDKAILDLTREGDAYFTKMSNYESEKTKLGLQVNTLDDLEKYIIEDRDPKFLPPSVYVNIGDAFLLSSASKLYSMQSTKNGLLIVTTRESPDFINLNLQIDSLKQDMLLYISNMRKATNERIRNVEVLIQEYVADIRTLPYKQRGLTTIQRKLNVNEGIYNFLLQKRASTIIARASIIPKTKIIETARESGIVSPDKKKLLNLFLSTAIGLAMLIIIIRSIFFEKIDSYDDLKSVTNRPILGEIFWSPEIGDLGLAIETDPRGVLSESFRGLRTNLQFLGNVDSSKVIVISSNSPGEGKTFCTLNLAATLAKAGKKVLILELDLHKPRVQKGLGLEALKGISTIAIGKDTIEDCVVKTHIENMDVILSGPLPPNPSELILSPKLEEILDYGRKTYDYVFIDTPPIGLISDGFILMKKADISLFVLNVKVAYRRDVNNVIELIENNNFTNFCFILNGIRRRRFSYYYKYGYRYSYRYGYGYGDKTKKQ